MHNEHELRIQKRLKGAKLQAFFLDSLLVYYSLFSLFYLIARLQGEEFPPSAYLIWTIPIAIVMGLLQSRSSSLGLLIIVATDKFLKQNVRLPLSAYKRGYFFAGFLVLLTLVMGFWITEISFPALLSSDGLEGAKRIFSSLLTPDLTILGMVLRAMLETVFIAFIATVLAIPIAFIMSFFTARNLMKQNQLSFLIYNLLRITFNFTRSVEPLIWAIVFSVWVGIGPFAGMLALMLHSIASLTKLYSEQIESIERGPIEAIEATGANRVQVIWFAIVPQIVLPYLSFTIYRWDINIRMATVIGLVGGGGVGTLLMQYQGLARWHEVGTIVIVIAAVVWFMDYLSAKLREAIY